jgi:moderate conductance mechanosensitive channel
MYLFYQFVLAMQMSDKVLDEAIKPEAWRRWSGQGGRVVLVLGIAWILTRLLKWTTARLRRYMIRLMDRRGEGETIDMEKRANTLISAFTKAVDLVIWTVAILAALSELNYHVKPLLAGLGIAGIAVGLGAQTIIKDWLGGFFLLIEDQVRIGDLVVINGIPPLSGVVESISLRTTLLRGENGALHVIANGSITALSNLTRDYSYYVFEMTLSHGADADRALTVLENVGNEVHDDEQYGPMMLSPIEVMGVERLAERGVVVKARIKTLPAKQALVGRELNRRVRTRLEAEGIAFPHLHPPQT